ncbi:nicotinate-nucleotide adenylyltransferase [uncultured Adlercreutzia sp.]|uniref:nicotinate-nucleotide adenylyltransferase n=1 Tax=uncultured Adlercreutzia sp. TaxID=875803 RepID=UPI00272EB190|nr:nicotinate-nucleotide adenylyltransferase [uncultured Adlercreutzia sp.]MCI9262197.1 nicotinate-nucleotide adenylyltransferase [Eggerthellaceae bacterium]
MQESRRESTGASGSSRRAAGETREAQGPLNTSARGAALGRFAALGQTGAPARLGIMGGTFDPIHFGHLACAQEALEALDLDGVLFMPAGIPSFKRDRAVSPAADRVRWCRKAVAGNEAFDVSTLEVDRPGVTYAVDTLAHLRDAYPSCVELFFIVGADAALTLPRWYESERLASLARFAVATRPGYTVSAEDRRSLEEHGFLLDFFEVTPLDISSSDLRGRLASGRSVRYLTPDAVAECLADEHWYRKEVV